MKFSNVLLRLLSQYVECLQKKLNILRNINISCTQVRHYHSRRLMQRQAMGVALHIVLLPFLNYCIAQLIHTMPTFMSAFFLPEAQVGTVVPWSYLISITLRRSGSATASSSGCQPTGWSGSVSRSNAKSPPSITSLPCWIPLKSKR